MYTPSFPRSTSYWQPTVGTTWAIQYTGTIDLSANVQAFNLDGFDTDASTITSLHAAGKKVICYFDAGSYEKGRPDATSFPSSVLGSVMDDWPDEKWLDISQVSILQPIMDARAKKGQDKGCDAIDWDNVDGYTNDSGFELTAAQQLTYNKMLSTITRARGMAVGLKNDLDQVADLISYFDFATNEQCAQYNECDQLAPFINACKPVFNIEYPSSVSDTASCETGNADGFMSVLKTMDLDATTFDCWTLQTETKRAVPATCSTSSSTISNNSTISNSSTAIELAIASATSVGLATASATSVGLATASATSDELATASATSDELATASTTNVEGVSTFQNGGGSSNNSYDDDGDRSQSHQFHHSHSGHTYSHTRTKRTYHLSTLTASLDDSYGAYAPASAAATSKAADCTDSADAGVGVNLSLHIGTPTSLAAAAGASVASAIDNIVSDYGAGSSDNSGSSADSSWSDDSSNSESDYDSGSGSEKGGESKDRSSTSYSKSENSDDTSAPSGDVALSKDVPTISDTLATPCSTTSSKPTTREASTTPTATTSTTTSDTETTSTTTSSASMTTSTTSAPKASSTTTASHTVASYSAVVGISGAVGGQALAQGGMAVAVLMAALLV